MSTFLSKILDSTRRGLEIKKRERPLERIKASLTEAPGAVRVNLFSAALSRPGISIIAEIKRASPSKGDIRPDLEVDEIVSIYEKAGADAVSVLTEENYFKGGISDLIIARRSCGLPLLRKDFIIDEYQVWEAAEAGADAILLIVAALEGDELDSLLSEAKAAGLECLVEVHDRSELETALAGGALIIGINNRNLKTFEVSLETTIELGRNVPDGVLTVGESGIKTPEDVSLLARAGVDAILVGESLMRSPEPGDKIKELRNF